MLLWKQRTMKSFVITFNNSEQSTLNCLRSPECWCLVEHLSCSFVHIMPHIFNLSASVICLSTGTNSSWRHELCAVNGGKLKIFLNVFFIGHKIFKIIYMVHFLLYCSPKLKQNVDYGAEKKHACKSKLYHC